MASSSASADPVEPIQIALISLNDFEGQIDDAAATVAFAGTIEERRAQHGESSTLLLSTGDVISRHLTQNPDSLDDKPTFDVLNALDMRASAVGNHDLHSWAPAEPTSPMSALTSFPYLSANILKSNTLVFPAYEIFDVAGLKVAVIGATTRDTPLLDPRAQLYGLKFAHPVAGVNVTAANLKASPDPPDIIVAAYHEGATMEHSAIGWNGDRSEIVHATSSDVDVVFTGHTQEIYNLEGPVPGEPGRTRPVMQNGFQGLSEVVLSVDPVTRRVVSYSAELVGRTQTPNATLIDTYPRVAEVKAILDRTH